MCRFLISYSQKEQCEILATTHEAFLSSPCRGGCGVDIAMLCAFRMFPAKYRPLYEMHGVKLEKLQPGDSYEIKKGRKEGTHKKQHKGEQRGTGLG